MVLAGALPVFLATDAPLAGYVGAGGAWLVQRFARDAVERRVKRTTEPRKVAALVAATLIGPIWFMSLAVLAIGLLAGSPAGLAAALLTLVLFTVSLATRLLLRTAGAPPAGAASPHAGTAPRAAA